MSPSVCTHPPARGRPTRTVEPGPRAGGWAETVGDIHSCPRMGARGPYHPRTIRRMALSASQSTGVPKVLTH